jgi:diguanylate cyclase (GGDEF)-like protein
MTLLALFWRFRRTEHNSIREQTRMLEHETMHDHLTGLPNRRRLMADLDSPGGRRLLVFFDLDGFKSYNDTFGHLEGDLLLERLGHKLARGVGSNGVAYRLGGDEFCVIAPLGMGEDDALVPRCVEALREDGEGFQVRASCGRVLMPDDASTGAAALVLADQRMYANKGAGRASARQQTRDVILRVLAERHPEVREHVSEVAVLARATGQRLGLGGTGLDELERAAELHDIGKIAIPDAILAKPGPLDEEEWRFMRRHTLIGESVLSAAPALASVAKVVRSSHERFDGGGYPDGLAGDSIPLASRIVFVCDAFHAMTSERPYGTPMSVENAIAELSRCAGTQFDPEVVIAFSAARAAPTPPLLVA